MYGKLATWLRLYTFLAFTASEVDTAKQIVFMEWTKKERESKINMKLPMKSLTARSLR